MTPFAQRVADLYFAGARLIYVVTEEEERAIQLCRAALEGDAGQAEGPELLVWSRTRGLEPRDRSATRPDEALRAIVAEGNGPAVALLLDFDAELQDRNQVRLLRDLLPAFGERRCCAVIVAPTLNLPAGLEAEACVIRLPRPDREELAALLGAMLPVTADGSEPESSAIVTAATGLTDIQAQRAFCRALQVDAGLGRAAVAAVLEEKRSILKDNGGLEAIDVVERPEDVGGLESYKTWIAERALAFSPDADQYGLPSPRGVMLVGVQGCGKSLAAKAAAALLGVPLLRLDLPRVMSAGDNSHQGLQWALENAEAIAPVALWVDEIEKAFAGSAAGPGGEPRTARLLGAFSTWLQERRSAVFVVATANDVTRLPPELLRRGRFDELFFVDLPDLDARREILGLHLAKRGRDPRRFDLQAIAEQCADYSGAELEQVVVGALHRAYALRRDVETQDLRRLAHDLVPLYRTYEETIKALREWARGRARRAGREAAVAELFRKAGAVS